MPSVGLEQTEEFQHDDDDDDYTDDVEDIAVHLLPLLSAQRHASESFLTACLLTGLFGGKLRPFSQGLPFHPVAKVDISGRSEYP